MMSAHVHGTGDLAYPEQDPAELRAQAVRDQFERVRQAQARYYLAWDRYYRAGVNPGSHGTPDYRPVDNARQALTRATFDAERVVIQALEEAGVQVVHDRPEGEP
jgi:hypothetical protein